LLSLLGDNLDNADSCSPNAIGYVPTRYLIGTAWSIPSSTDHRRMLTDVE